MEELAEESRRLKSLISAKEAEEAEIEQVRREGRRLVALGNSKKSEADKAASHAAKAAETAWPAAVPPTSTTAQPRAQRISASFCRAADPSSPPRCGWRSVAS